MRRARRVVFRGPGGVTMLFLKRYMIRSFEMGLYFRDGEFRGLLQRRHALVL